MPKEDLTPFGEPLARLGFDSPTFRWFAHFKHRPMGLEIQGSEWPTY